MTERNVVMLSCGHAANAKDGKGNPTCAICFGLTKDPITVVKGPDLSKRLAKCPSCGVTKPSSLGLAFFEYRPDFPHDLFYCGCRGWD